VQAHRRIIFVFKAHLDLVDTGLAPAGKVVRRYFESLISLAISAGDRRNGLFAEQEA